jgi:hypothetical protein
MPFYLMSVVIFNFREIKYDVACELAYLTCKADGHKNATLSPCQSDPTSYCKFVTNDASVNIGLDILSDLANWRWPLFIIAIYFPLVVVLFELAVNRVMMRLPDLFF